MGSLMSALPRPGGLLDAMRQRGTLPAKGISGLFAAAPAAPAAMGLRLIPRALEPSSPASSPRELPSPRPPAASPQKPKPCVPAAGAAASPLPSKAEAAAAAKRSGSGHTEAKRAPPPARKGAGSLEAEAPPNRKGSGNGEVAAGTPQKRKASADQAGQRASAEAGQRASAEAPARKASAEASGTKTKPTTPAGKPASKKAASLDDMSPQMSPPRSPLRPAQAPLATTPSPQATKSRAKRPPVPSFASVPEALRRQVLEPWESLRRIKLAPKKLEDNYEISDKGEDSDEEPDRSQKRIPDWSGRYMELIESQLNTDPDTIFGSKVPKCDLDLIFKDAMYAKIRTERPRRRRGSSQEWHRDRLSRSEICLYKKKMGHAKRWIARKLSIAPAVPPPVVVLDGA